MFYWFGSQKNIIRCLPSNQLSRAHLSSDSILKGYEASNSEIYLTFDDGPDPSLTPQVLDLLARYEAKASFFVIGIRARENQALINRMLGEGHSVFSHSLDHNYQNYFKPRKVLKKWIQDSLEDLSQLTGEESLVFRPPAGVLTPPLVQVAQELEIKLLLWNLRFFDSVWPWYQWHGQLHLSRLRGGDVVLLHDCQRPKLQNNFLLTLQFFLESLRQKKFGMKKISEKELVI